MKYTTLKKHKKFKQHKIYKNGTENVTLKQIWKCINCKVQSTSIKIFHLKCKMETEGELHE